MSDKLASNSNNISSDDDFEDRSVLKFYQNTKSINSKNDDSSKGSVSETSFAMKEVITKKVDRLTYLDLRKSDEDDLKYFIDFPLKYNGTIYECPVFAELSLRDQVKLLCSYHSKLSKNISNQAKLQIERAPLPKLIKTSTKCPISMLLNDVEMDITDGEQKENDNLNSFDALLNSVSYNYVSKSGRVTKRRFYSETEDLNMKKLKVRDGEWHNSKQTSTTSKGSAREKKIPLEADIKNFDNKTVSDKKAESISTKNVDIMSRSRLFKEKSPTKNTRWAKMTEVMAQQTLKHEEEEAKLEEFNKSLSISDEITEYIEDNGNSPVRRRVKPPPLKSKGGRPKKQKEPYAELQLTTQKSPLLSSKAQTEKSCNVKSHVQKKIRDFTKDEVSASTSVSQKSTENMVQCPICSRDFENTEIEEHASSCGENMVETRSNNSSLSNMSCRFCDKVFVNDRMYEEHVKSCRERRNSSK